jgi:hypothetical protein
MQHATAIGISPGKWSSRTRLPTHTFAENPAGASYFRQTSAHSGTQYLPFIIFINELSDTQGWNAFCMLAVRQ